MYLPTYAYPSTFPTRPSVYRRLLSKWGLGTYQLPPPPPGTATSTATATACRQARAVTLRLAGCAPERRRVSAAELAASLPPRVAAVQGTGAALHFVDEWERDEWMTCQFQPTERRRAAGSRHQSPRHPATKQRCSVRDTSVASARSVEL